MRIKSLRTLAITCGALLVGSTLLQSAGVAQRTVAPVEVVNTTANPVPIAGGVAITNTPTVDARQSGSWSVNIAGTHTVQLDPTANTVKVTRRASYQRTEQITWTG